MSGSPPSSPSRSLLSDEAEQSWILPPVLSGTSPNQVSLIPGQENHAQTPASAAAASTTRRRQHTVAAFLKQGETNETFKEKAPSILNTYWTQQQQQQQANAPSSSSSSSSSGASKPRSSRDPSPPALRHRLPNSSSSISTSNSIRAERPSGLRRFWQMLAQPFTKSSRHRRHHKHSRGSRNSKSGNGNSGDDGDDDDSGDDLGGAGGHVSGESSSDSDDDENQHASVDKLDASRARELEEDEDVEASNFETVDWRRQGETDFLDYHQLQEPPPQLLPGGRGCCGVFWSKIVSGLALALHGLHRGWRASQGWVICALVGLTTGLLASMVDMCVHWVIDIRVGLCDDNIWLSNKNCCAGIDGNMSPGRNLNDLQQVCPLWRNWDVILRNWGLPIHPMDDYITNYVVYVFISCVLAVTSCWVVATWARYAAGSGIPEIKTILGGVVIRRVLGGWTLFIKCVSLVLSVSSGLSVGKEGPFVHIAACVGNIWSKIFPRYRHNPAKTNEILSAACAAGVAVAFGAPIGGILYSLEEISSFFPHKTMWRAFFCSMIASLSVTYIDPFQQNKLVQFQIDYTNPWQWFEMLPFFTLGVIGGLFGAFFVWANVKISRARRSSFLARWPMTEVGIVAIVSTLIRFQSAYTRGNTTGLLETLFADCNRAPSIDPLDMCNPEFISNTLGNLFFASIVTLLLTTYTIGLPIPSGLLIPSLTIGAAMGRFVGTLVRYLQITNPSWGWGTCQSGDPLCITPGIYALVGGAAVLGGVTRMTIALVVIIFEISGGTTYLLPVMVAVMTSKVVGDYFGTDSIYEGAIETLQYPFLDVKHEIPSDLKVKDAMTSGSDLLVLSIHGHTIATLHERLKMMPEVGISGFPIVTSEEDMLVVGYITRSELKAGLRYAIRYGGSGGSGNVHSNTPCYFAMLDLRFPRTGPYVDLSGLLDPAPVQVSEHMALYRLHDLFSKLGLRYCIVARFGKAIGFVTKKDIIKCLHHHH